MKKRLLTVAFLMGAWGAYSQVGIGTTTPNRSSQLEVVAKDKGILIPQVPLKSSTDKTTIANNNVNSLLVWNTSTVADITPGYYYWFVDKWMRIVDTDTFASLDSNTKNTSLTIQGSDLVLTDSDGGTVSIPLAAINIPTTLVKNPDGTYTYTNEEGATVTIDATDNVIHNIENILGDTNVLNELITVLGDTYVGGNVYYDGDIFTYVTQDGETKIINFNDIVKANETVTTLVAGADGKYTYTSEDNTVTVIDIPASVVENFETIVNDGPVEINGDTFTTIEDYITHIANNVSNVEGSDFITVTGDGSTTNPYEITIKEGDVNSMLITNATGELEWATIESIVKDNETVTRIEEADGIYTYYNEEDTPYIIDIPASVVENFENIYNQIVNEEITVEGEHYNTFEEYLTTIITSNTNFEDNDFIAVSGTGTDTDPFKIEIKEGANNTMLITNAAGELEWATIESIVQANETVTRIEEADGIYTYYNEENTPFVIDIPASVVENFENIYNQIVNEEITVDGDHYNTFEEYLTTIINNNTNFEDNDFIAVTGTGTDADPFKIEIQEGANNTMLITDENGDLQWATIESIVQANETVTRIEEEDGIYTYYNEENTPFIIDIPASVVENFENIYNQIVNEEITVDGNHYNTFEEYLTTIINNNTNFEDNDFITVTGSGTDADPFKIEIQEGANNTMLITDENGDLQWATIESIVKDNETVTRIEEADGIYTYYNEEDTPFIIDIPASVVENFENIYNQIVNEEITVDGNHYNTFEEYLTTIINNNTNFEDNDFITVTGSGTDADPFKIEIKEGANNSMLITNATGELEWATIESIVKANETVTRIEELDGIYTYYNEEDTPFIIDIPASVIENFENIYNQIVSEEITVDGNHYNTFEEYLTTIINNNTNFEDNDFITVTGSGTDADPYKIEIKEGSNNSMLITNAAGELEWATIESIVKANETVTRIEEADGIYTYYNEEDTPFIIDIPASVIENFENIYNQIVNEEITVDGNHYNTFEEYLTTIINNNTNFEDNDFITVTGSGTDADPFKIEIKEGANNSMLITNATGELEWATIESIVQANETVTTVVDNTDGTYTYINEEEEEFVISIPASIVESFETIVNSGPVIVGGEEYTTIEEYIEYIANASVTVEGSDFITVTGDGTSGNPYEITIKEGAANSMLITNAAGELEWATIESIVKGNETVTVLVKNADGTYTYYNENEIDADGTPLAGATGVTIDPKEVSVALNTTTNIYEFKNSAGDVIGSIDMNADNVAFDNTNNDFTSDDVQGALEELFDKIENAKGDLVVGGGLEFTGATTGIAKLLADANIQIADGGVTTDKLDDKAVTADKLDGGQGAADRVGVADADGNITYKTLDEVVKANETVTVLVKNADGTYTYYNENEIDADGTPLAGATGVTIDPKEVSVALNTTTNIYEFKNSAGDVIGSIDMNADNVAFDNTNNDFTSEDVQGALEELFDKIENAKGDLVVAGGLEFTGGTTGIAKLLADANIQIADGGVTTDKLDDKAVTADKIAGGRDGEILVTDGDNGAVKWVSKEEATSNALALDGNKLTSTVNGVEASVELTDANVISTKGITGTGITVDGGAGATLKDVTLTLTPGDADQVMITKNGVATWVDQSEIVPETTNELESSGNILTSTVNGEEATADIINSVANSLDTDGNLITTVNGVAGDGLDLTPAIQANQKTVTVVDGTNTTVTANDAGTTGNNTEYQVHVSDAAIQEAVTLAGDVTGKAGETNLVAIQGTPVIANGTKTTGQALVFDGTNWVPGKPLVDATDVLNAKDLTAADADDATIEVATGGTAAVLVETSLRVKAESITTGHIQDGTIAPVDIADAGANQVLVTGADKKPVWKDQNKVAPQFFYMPAVIFDTQATGTATRDLYQEYVNQFTGGAVGAGNATYPISHGPTGTTPVQYTGGIVGSTGAPADIAVLDKGDLYYYVTYYDEAVFENLSIDVDGKLTYTVKAGATPNSYMNIVFVIK